MHSKVRAYIKAWLKVWSMSNITPENLGLASMPIQPHNPIVRPMSVLITLGQFGFRFSHELPGLFHHMIGRKPEFFK